MNPNPRPLPRLLTVAATLLWLLPLLAPAASYLQWTQKVGLTAEAANINADPDGDGRINALEYAFGSDPKVAEMEAVGPTLREFNGLAVMTYPVGTDAQGAVSYRVFEATDVTEVSRGTEIDATPHLELTSSNYSLYSQYFDATADVRFYRLAVTIPRPMAPGPNQVVILVGADIGGTYWQGMPTLTQAVVRTQPPPVSDTDSRPNRTMYPEVVGTSQIAATPDLLATMDQSGRRLPRRSWMGWFLWGNGTPPPGIEPGIPVTGSFDTNAFWDFFSYQFPSQGSAQPPPGQSWAATYGQWKPVRMDQQPLYANPFRVNYAWPPGAFGYRSQPLKPFPDQTQYWADKRIVRGPNFSFANPFFVQYGDRVQFGDTPDSWRDSWFYQRTRPLETLILVPSNLKPDELLQPGPWNTVETVGNDPFPYPVWNTALAARDQTPFAILTDRMGDWDADLIWEGTHPRAAGYATNRYQRTSFDRPGIGNYLKMTVAQGSPFIWCEANNNRYQIFYNLIRQNLTNRIANALGTDAKVVPGGPWPVPGASGLNYVLIYGDHNNPNQWHHAEQPWYFDAQKGEPGGFNPPGAQHNHTYVAVFYRADSVQPVTLGAGGPGAPENNGTDAQGNPYFYLEFKNPGKNWFVLGSVPVMSYYHSSVPEDTEDARIAGARAWAEQMGPYAFNFLVDTKISYASENMTAVSTTYRTQLRNPYVVSGDASGASLTPNPSATVMALLPHQYQPITLGPDLTRASRPSVVWNVLQGYDQDFPRPAAAPPNANRNDVSTTSRWDYWSPRGTMKSIVSGSFVTRYPFQNFLPMLPPANLETNYTQSGIQAVQVTSVGSGYRRIDNSNLKATIQTTPGTPGSGAVFKVLLEPHTGRVMQVDVVNGGAGYPDGNPPPTNVWITIDPPQTPPANGGVQATARLQIGGGKVLAVFMNNKGAGYESTIQVEQDGVTFDAPIIEPPYDASGNLTTGLARIWTGGAGFDFSSTNPIRAKIIGTGQGATVEVVPVGGIVSIRSANIGGFSSAGHYPSTGDDAADAARVTAQLTLPGSGQPAQQVAVTAIDRTGGIFKAVIDQGKYGSKPSPYLLLDDGTEFALDCNYDPGSGVIIDVSPANGAPEPTLSSPREVQFRGGDPVTRPAKITVYGAFAVRSVAPTGARVPGYSGVPEVTFHGGGILPTGVRMPVLKYTFKADGTLDPASLEVVDPGAGWKYTSDIRIAGGRGFDAAAIPIVGSDGGIQSVRMVRGGNNYPANVYARLISSPPPQVPAQLQVRVVGGSIVGIDVQSPGSGYRGQPVILFTSVPNGDPGQSPAKGPFARITYGYTPDGQIVGARVIDPGQGYVPGAETTLTTNSPASYLELFSPGPLVIPTAQAQGFVAQVVNPEISVKQTLLDNLISEYSLLTGENLKPFGAAIGGIGGDGYGLGNSLSAASKVVTLLYQVQQHYAQIGLDVPDIAPSAWAADFLNLPVEAFELPVYRDHLPPNTLSGALKSSVQGLQRTLSLFHQNPPYTNNPPATDWKVQYFAQYDDGAGRLVINPSGTLPVQGVVSSIPNPPELPYGRDFTDPLKNWEPGRMFSGFGVSDQWNDQHYFFGYYLGTAGLASILDQSWQPDGFTRPTTVWSDAGQLGKAIDQWLMTLAYDPDNQDLNSVLNFEDGFTYQKFSFFDQWSGHGWATGVSPGKAGDVEDGQFGNLVPWSIWRSHGTGDAPYDDQNENSIWEGLQAWSAIVLWGGGTDRKPVVDLGMYLLATGNAAGDAYFHDKNYNLPLSPANQYSWVPVTTVASSQVGNNGGNNNTPANSGLVETTPEAFYTAPEAFGGAASAGSSILHKGSPSLNNFFYAFPTGSKFIQSFPPAPWTLGMTRNTDYMRRWAGSMMRQEWTDARNSSLYQAGDWLGMAIASAYSGVPYNPGDQPYPLTGTTPKADAPEPYVKRVWSSWSALDTAAGDQAARPPVFTSIDVLNTLHVLEEYGTADWTYVARATDSSGAADNSSIVFTATFSKLISPTTVRTTFVAFNPGWTTRYATFYRLGADGSLGTTPVLPQMPVQVKPKRMTVVTHDFAVQ